MGTKKNELISQKTGSTILNKNTVNPFSYIYSAYDSTSNSNYYSITQPATVTSKNTHSLNDLSTTPGSPQALINALQQSNNSIEQITNGLRKIFKLGAQEIIQLLKNSKFSAEDTAKAIKSNFNSSDPQIAQWLQIAGYRGGQVASALKNSLHATAPSSANITKKLFSASVSQVAHWLKSAGYSPVQVAQALETIETDPQKIIQALKNSFNLSSSQLVSSFKEIQKIFTPQNCRITDCEKLAQYLKNIGYPLNDVLIALKKYFNISVQAAHKIGVNIYRSSNIEIQEALANAGYSSQQISSVENAKR